MKQVVLKSTYEFHGEEANQSDQKLIQDAKEAFYLDGANVSAEVIEVEGNE